MAYEYEYAVINELENIEDEYKLDYGNEIKEVREVYRKAKAFDGVKEFVDKKIKEEEEKQRILLDDYDYGLNQAYNNVDDIIQEHMGDE